MNKKELEIEVLRKRLSKLELEVAKERVEDGHKNWKPSTLNISKLHKEGCLNDLDGRGYEGDIILWNGWTITLFNIFNEQSDYDSQYYIILEFSKNGEYSYWKVPGFSTSYGGENGLLWHSAFEVRGVERVITDWEVVKN